MITEEISAGLSRKLVSDMYTKKPKINEDNEMVFRKSGAFLFSGIIIIFLFSLCALFMNYYVSEIIQENNLNSNVSGTLYICGYSFAALFILFGIKLIIMFLFHKIIVSKDAITSKKMFLTRTIKFIDLEAVTYSNRRCFVFKGNDTKIAFGNFTVGLIEMIKFLDKNIPKHKCEAAIDKAKRMLR